MNANVADPNTDGAGDVAVKAEGLSKTYRLGEIAGLQQTIRRFRAGATAREAIEAIRDVSFTVAVGEILGIVGANGSGKSTILRILAGITVPTRGMMRVRGTVLPTVATGAGFHPDLTGRENVVLFGSILGVERKAVGERMEEILAFAEIGSHADTPVKRYSDGMQARLGLAIALTMPADIYIFDEVLVFVDGEFRGRCLDRIVALARSGKTVFFVTHNLEQLRDRADRVMWMRDAEIHRLGPTRDVLADYERADEHPAQSAF